MVYKTLALLVIKSERKEKRKVTWYTIFGSYIERRESDFSPLFRR